MMFGRAVNPINLRAFGKDIYTLSKDKVRENIDLMFAGYKSALPEEAEKIERHIRLTCDGIIDAAFEAGDRETMKYVSDKLVQTFEN